MKSKKKLSPYKSLLPGHFLLGTIVGGIAVATLFTLVNAQLEIPTALNNAIITIKEVLLSSDGLDTPGNPSKVRIFADGSFSNTLVVSGSLKVTDLITPTPSTYLVTTDKSGVLSFVDASAYEGSNTGSSKRINSPTVDNGIYYNNKTAVGANSDTNFAFKVFDETNALRIENGAIQFDQLGSRVSTNGAGVMTVNSQGTVSLAKLTDEMVDPAFLSQISNLWQQGADATIYYTSGNVGVKTATPLTELQVAGDILSDRAYVANGKSTFTNDGSNAYWYAGNNITIGSEGKKVAIGGVSPDYSLHVNGETYIDSPNTGDSGLIFADLTSGSNTLLDIGSVGCKVLSVDGNGRLILIDATDACGINNGGDSLTWQDICSECRGGVIEITFEYLGSSSVLVNVEDNSNTYFSDNVNPGDTFSVFGNKSDGTFAKNNIDIIVDGENYYTFKSNCSDPINPGIEFGDFKIIRVRSKNGGFECPLP